DRAVEPDADLRRPPDDRVPDRDVTARVDPDAPRQLARRRRRAGDDHVDQDRAERGAVRDEIDARAAAAEAPEVRDGAAACTILVLHAVVEELDAARGARAAAVDRDIGRPGRDRDADAAPDLIGRRADDLELVQVERLAIRRDPDPDRRVRAAHRAGELHGRLAGLEERRADRAAAADDVRAEGGQHRHRDQVRDARGDDGAIAVAGLLAVDRAVGVGADGQWEVR